MVGLMFRIGKKKFFIVFIISLESLMLSFIASIWFLINCIKILKIIEKH